MIFTMKYYFLATFLCTQSFFCNARSVPELGIAPLSEPADGQHLSLRSGEHLSGTYTPHGDFNNLVRWEDMTSHDGIKSGSDPDKILYIRDLINLYLKRIPTEKRTGVFWSGGNKKPEDMQNIREFISTDLKGKGSMYYDWWTLNDIKHMGLDPSKKGGTYWRMTNRVSKALAAGATNGKAYVYMQPSNCRTIFSLPSQNPQDNDPTAQGQATNGEIWYYAELPMLMRNLDISQIITFYKDGEKFISEVAWDVDRDTDKPRDYLQDIAMDATPIVLPPAAKRPPLRRGKQAHVKQAHKVCKSSNKGKKQPEHGKESPKHGDKSPEHGDKSPKPGNKHSEHFQESPKHRD